MLHARGIGTVDLQKVFDMYLQHPFSSSHHQNPSCSHQFTQVSKRRALASQLRQPSHLQKQAIETRTCLQGWRQRMVSCTQYHVPKIIMLWPYSFIVNSPPHSLSVPLYLKKWYTSFLLLGASSADHWKNFCTHTWSSTPDTICKGPPQPASSPNTIISFVIPQWRLGTGWAMSFVLLLLPRCGFLAATAVLLATVCCCCYCYEKVYVHEMPNQ